MLTTEIGKRGENIASLYLQHKGYKIVETNWKTRWCEINIVCEKDDCAYFVEVKYRSNNFQGEGYEYVTPKKLQQMQFGAEFWAQSHNYEGDMQLLVASVSADENVQLFELA